MKSFLVKFTYNTNAIEGNTLSLKETGLILRDGISPRGKKLKEILEAKNMEKCFEYMLKYKGDITWNGKKLRSIVGLLLTILFSWILFLMEIRRYLTSH